MKFDIAIFLGIALAAIVQLGMDHPATSKWLTHMSSLEACASLEGACPGAPGKPSRWARH